MTTQLFYALLLRRVRESNTHLLCFQLPPPRQLRIRPLIALQLRRQRSLLSELADIANNNSSSPTSSSISEVSVDSAIARFELASSRSHTALHAAVTADDLVSRIALRAVSTNEGSVSRKAPRAASTDVATITHQLRQLSRLTPTVHPTQSVSLHLPSTIPPPQAELLNHLPTAHPTGTVA